MILLLQDSIEALKIHLFNYNYTDRRLISKIKSKTDYIEKDGGIVVSAEDIKKVLNLYFKKEVQVFKNQPSGSIYRNANSLFFINQFLENFSCLKYLEIFISNNRNYSRVKKEYNLAFDYHILRVKADLTEFNSIYIESFLKDIGYDTGIQINNIEFDVQDFANKMDAYFYVNDETFGSYQKLVDKIDFFMDEKVIEDNPKIVLKIY